MLFRKTVFDTILIASTNIFRMLAQLFVVPILARFLSPEDYGVVAIAMPFVLLGMMFTDAGVGMSLVRTKDNNPQEWSTCFWLTTCLGLALMLLISLSSPLVAYFFSEPELTPIIMALSFVVFLQSLCIVPGVDLQKGQKFWKVTVTEISSMILSIACALYAAIDGWGAWALVLQQLVQYSVRLLLTLCFMSFRPKIIFELAAIKHHLVFGRDKLGSNFIGFIVNSLDALAVGRVIGTAAAGIYSMGFLFSCLPMRIVGGPVQYVLYPKFAKIHENVDMLRRVFLMTTRILSILIIPAIGMVAVAHEPVFKVLLSEKWALAGVIFMLTAFGGALRAVTGLTGVVMMAMNRVDIELRTTFEYSILRAVLILSAVHFGIEWVAIAFSLSGALYLPRLLQAILPILNCKIIDYLKQLFVPILVTLGFIMIYEIFINTGVYGDWSKIFMAAGLSITGIALSTAVQIKSLRKEIKVFSQAFS